MGLKKADFSRLGRVADAMHDELLPFMADVIRTDTDPYVPARTMSLATSAFVNEADLQEGRIVYAANGTAWQAIAKRQADAIARRTK